MAITHQPNEKLTLLNFSDGDIAGYFNEKAVIHYPSHTMVCTAYTFQQADPTSPAFDPDSPKVVLIIPDKKGVDFLIERLKEYREYLED